MESIEKNSSYISNSFKVKTKPLGYHKDELLIASYSIINFTIRPGGKIDVKGDVNLSNKKLDKIPFDFGTVTGSFLCKGNNLASLKGAPEKVGERFECSHNKMLSLKEGPKEVGETFDCSGNQLKNLKGAPEKININFYCYRNLLTSLEGSPKEIGLDFSCQDNKLVSLKGGPKEVGGVFQCYRNAKEFTEEDVRAVSNVKGPINIY